nr:hypothetical protein [Cressdnaviricota sp.]
MFNSPSPFSSPSLYPTPSIIPSNPPPGQETRYSTYGAIAGGIAGAAATVGGMVSLLHPVGMLVTGLGATFGYGYGALADKISEAGQARGSPPPTEEIGTEAASSVPYIPVIDKSPETPSPPPPPRPRPRYGMRRNPLLPPVETEGEISIKDEL